MVYYGCAFSQSELGKYFEWIITSPNLSVNYLFFGQLSVTTVFEANHQLTTSPSGTLLVSRFCSPEPTWLSWRQLKIWNRYSRNSTRGTAPSFSGQGHPRDKGKCSWTEVSPEWRLCWAFVYFMYIKFYLGIYCGRYFTQLDNVQKIND